MDKRIIFLTCFALSVLSFATAEEPQPSATETASYQEIQVTELPPYCIAYVRTVGAYGTPGVIGPAFEKAVDWVSEKGLFTGDTLVIGIGWDDPAVTPPEECRYDACVTVPAGTAGDDEVAVADIPGGTYAIYKMTGKYETISADFGPAWGAVAGWMAASDYEYDMRPVLEIYKETEEQFKAGEYVLDLCIPIKKK